MSSLTKNQNKFMAKLEAKNQSIKKTFYYSMPSRIFRLSAAFGAND